MGYEVHNFQSGAKLYASQLNEMDAQIEDNAGAIGVEPIVFYDPDDPHTLDAYVQLNGTIKQNAGNRIVWMELIDGQEFTIKMGKTQNIDTTFHFSETRPDYGVVVTDIKFICPSSYTSFEKTFTLPQGYRYIVVSYANSSATRYTDAEVLSAISVKYDGENGSGILKRIRALEDGLTPVIGVKPRLWYDKTNPNVLDAYVNGRQIITQNIGNRTVWMRVKPGAEFTITFGKTQNINGSFYFCSERPDYGIATSEPQTWYIPQSATSYTRTFVVPDGYNYILCNYANSNATRYPDAEVLASITLACTDDVTVKGVVERVDELEKATGDNVVARNADALDCIAAISYSNIYRSGHAQEYHQPTLLLMTDVHATQQATKNFVEYLNAVPYIDAGINLGDTANSYYSDTDGTWYSSIVNGAKKPLYTLLGNHDVGNSKLSSRAATTAQAFTKWIKPSQPDATAPYYSFTINDVTFVCLNNYDHPDNTDASGNFLVFRGIEQYRQAQIDWLLSTLDAVPAGNTLVVCMHSFGYANTPLDCNWSQPQRVLNGAAGAAAYTDMIPEIIDVWKRGTSINKTFAARSYVTDYVGDDSLLPSITVNHNFGSRGAGKFACYLVGHSHADVVAHHSTFTDQLVFGFTTASMDMDQSQNGDLPRAANGKTYDAISAVTIDTKLQMVKLVRIGSNKTVYAVDRTMYGVGY